MGKQPSHVYGVYGRRVPAESVSEGARTVDIASQNLLKDDYYNVDTNARRLTVEVNVTAVRGKMS